LQLVLKSVYSFKSQPIVLEESLYHISKMKT
jgi:hypothetical protein